MGANADGSGEIIQVYVANKYESLIVMIVMIPGRSFVGLALDQHLGCVTKVFSKTNDFMKTSCTRVLQRINPVFCDPLIFSCAPLADCCEPLLFLLYLGLFYINFGEEGFCFGQIIQHCVVIS